MNKPEERLSAHGLVEPWGEQVEEAPESLSAYLMLKPEAVSVLSETAQVTILNWRRLDGRLAGRSIRLRAKEMLHCPEGI